FTHEEAWGLVQKVLLEPPPSLRQAVRGLPRDLELICLKCLEKDPRDRYATAAELADDLEAFLDGRPVAARPIPAAGPACRWISQPPAPPGLIAVAAVLMFVVPPLAIWYQGRLDTSQAKAAEATKAEAEAKRAQHEAEKLAAARQQVADQAQKAQLAAEQLASARERFALESSIDRRVIDRPPGWSWENRTDLIRAAELTTDPAARVGLRSAAAVTLLAPDFRPVEPVAGGLTASAVATSPDGSVIALGEFKAWGLGRALSCRVWLVDPATGKTVRRLSYPSATVATDDGLAQGGVRSLAFSPDGTRLYVGTRSSCVHRFDLTDPKADRPASMWPALAHPVEQLPVSPAGPFLVRA